MTETLRVLMIAPVMSREATGEGFVAFKFAQAMAPRVRLAVASFQSPHHTPLAEQLPGVEVLTWPEPDRFMGGKRFQAMFKPGWFLLCRHISKFLRKEAGRFDITHQVMPQAMRYASPLRGHGVPYVIGPLGGALPTPPALAGESAKSPWYTHLRKIDSLRLRHDPALRASYAEAGLVLGVAPYVRERLASVPLQAYANMLELGIDGLPQSVPPADPNAPLRLLHVGRLIRTKGLRDVIRALGQLPDLPLLTLTSAGAGEDLAACQHEVEKLGLSGRVRFLGLRPRSEIETLYQQADIFVFPSFREPAGNVLFEAMRWGLPVIAADYGGPQSIVDDRCGLRIPIGPPDRFAADIASAIRRLAGDTALRQRLGAGGRARVMQERWPEKAARLEDLYRQTLARVQA